jgi:(2R)-sulfolactate sulfo-lyase subunit alpha
MPSGRALADAPAGRDGLLAARAPARRRDVRRATVAGRPRSSCRCYIRAVRRAERIPEGDPVTIHFVVHEEGDSVGTIVVEGVKAGDALTGWIMEQDKTVNVKTLNDIPIGHKIALKELKNGDTVIKYGVDIGRTVAPIKLGEYLHVHNVKTKRW